MSILLTGFEPFGGSDRNPSELLARAHDGQVIAGHAVISAILPVERVGGPAALLAAIERVQPAAVVCMGLHGGLEHVALERVAVNLLDYRIADNAGNLITDQPVVEGGPAAYFATLPLRAMQAAIQAAGAPVSLSLSAGTFLCNQVMYTLLHYLAQHSPRVLGGFIHLPWLPEQAALSPRPTPSMALETSLLAIRTALAVIAQEVQE